MSSVAGIAPRRAAADLLTLTRPGQWAKNLLVVPLPLLDTFQWGLPGLGRVAWAVVVFTLASSLVYVGNDVADRHRDREHPLKGSRPIASGRVSVAGAWFFATILLVCLLALLAAQPAALWWPVLAYIALNVAYSRKLKHLPLFDVSTVAAGFALRLVQGYVALGEPVSGWLVVAVFALCLLLIVGKRRHELLTHGARHRPALRGYTVALTDHLLVLNAVVMVTAALQYLSTEAPIQPYGTAALILSTPFVMFGLARYLQVVLVRDGGGDPVKALLTDRVLLGAGLLWTGLISGLITLAHL